MDTTSSLERIHPNTIAADDAFGQNSLALHLERYSFAATHARPEVILDIACGVGYGTQLLAEQVSDAHRVVGVDLDPAAIAIASSQYADRRCQWCTSDALLFLDEHRKTFDTVVSLETIEHLPSPALFFAKVAAALKEGGRFIASVPVTPSTDFNTFHLHDFTEQSFLKLHKSHGFTPIDRFEQRQSPTKFVLQGKQSARLHKLPPDLLLRYLKRPSLAWMRLQALLRYGLETRYLTVVSERS